MVRLGIFSAIALAITGSGLDAAPSEPDIVVQGNRNFEEEVSDFVSALAPGANRSQLKRFEVAVCPQAFGLTEEQNRFVATRIKKVASETGVSQGGKNCIPNLWVIVTPNKRRFLEELSRHYPGIFPDDWSSGRVRALIQSSDPAVSWQYDDKIWYDGRLSRGVSAGSPDYAAGSKLTFTSRLTPSARRIVIAAFVVIQADAITGLTPTQVADYASMRALSKAGVNAVENLPKESILGVVGAPMNSSVPATLTAWDMSYLRALYKSDNKQYAGPQRSSIKRLMAKNLKQ